VTLEHSRLCVVTPSAATSIPIWQESTTFDCNVGDENKTSIIGSAFASQKVTRWTGLL